MCLEHASTIDDPLAVPTYHPDLLREWKAAQIDRYRSFVATGISTGWQLTTAMAESVAASSFSNVGIAIVNSTLYLGGQGGQGPGAGGGGGGAIGTGARAGNGGQAGRMLDLEGNPLPDDHEPSWQPSSEGERPPGSGGGGGGAVGEGAVAGDGGGGGDYVFGQFDVEEGDVCEVVVGASDDRQYLPGEHRDGGGDSQIVIRSKTGEVKRTIRAAGGAGARSGTLPDDWLQIGDRELADGFSIPALFASRAAEFHDGSLFCFGGGVGWNIPAVLPCGLTFLVTCMAQWLRLEPANVYGLQLCLVDPNAVERSRLALRLPIDAPDVTSWTWIQQIGAKVETYGVWTVTVQSGGHALAKLLLNIVPAPAPEI